MADIASIKKVSLFTREWIEMFAINAIQTPSLVSLFTREWIEISAGGSPSGVIVSPSLRGSGLKFFDSGQDKIRRCLPLYEGVD